MANHSKLLTTVLDPIQSSHWYWYNHLQLYLHCLISRWYYSMGSWITLSCLLTILQRLAMADFQSAFALHHEGNHAVSLPSLLSTHDVRHGARALRNKGSPWTTKKKPLWQWCLGMLLVGWIAGWLYQSSSLFTLWLQIPGPIALQTLMVITGQLMFSYVFHLCNYSGNKTWYSRGRSEH